MSNESVLDTSFSNSGFASVAACPDLSGTQSLPAGRLSSFGNPIVNKMIVVRFHQVIPNV
jgi:hypothetical protein